jgi:flagellar P-ring protein precursor FlgI
MVTASLPAFAQPGQTIDITVSSMGNAKSLRGGTLLMTPLQGADGQVYAMAQGNVLVGGVGAGGRRRRGRSQVNHLSGRQDLRRRHRRTRGRLEPGRGQPDQAGTEHHRLRHRQPRGRSHQRQVRRRHRHALDGRVIRVRSRRPQRPARVLPRHLLENMDVKPAEAAAKVIMNARTGSVVMNRAVTLDTCAISHGNLSVTVNADTQVSQPAPAVARPHRGHPEPQVGIKKDRGKVMLVKGGASLAEVVKAMNAIGATPARPAVDPAGAEGRRFAARRTRDHLSRRHHDPTSSTTTCPASFALDTKAWAT